jgi:uncharacterized membrane protein
LPESWRGPLERWIGAGLIDPSTGDRIRAFEARRDQSQGLRWPVRIAVSFGALMLGAGVLLFVAAHWDRLSPAVRFEMVLLLVAVFHVAGALIGERFSGLSIAFHAVGTASLGAGIFLAGQIFNLQEHWPTGILLWAGGAWAGRALLSDWVQAAFAALLTPAWLASEWLVATERMRGGDRILAEGLLLLSITYLTANLAGTRSRARRGLVWMGALALFPCTLYLVFARGWESLLPATPGSWQALGWLAAFAMPLTLAFILRGRGVWINLVAALWVFVGGTLAGQFVEKDIRTYLWSAIGSIALVGWGAREDRREGINWGVAGFGLTVLGFYFSNVMDKLSRSASLVGLGLLFLGGGWLLERTRRRLVAQIDRGAA